MCAAQAAPSMILVFLVVVLCAVACKDAFNDEVHKACARRYRGRLCVTGYRYGDRACLLWQHAALTDNFFPHSGGWVERRHGTSCSRDNWSYTALVAVRPSCLAYWLSSLCRFYGISFMLSVLLAELIIGVSVPWMLDLRVSLSTVWVVPAGDHVSVCEGGWVAKHANARSA